MRMDCLQCIQSDISAAQTPRNCHCSAQLRPPLKGFAVQGHCCGYVFTPAGLHWPQRQWQVRGPCLKLQKLKQKNQSEGIPVTPRVTHTHASHKGRREELRQGLKARRTKARTEKRMCAHGKDKKMET